MQITCTQVGTDFRIAISGELALETAGELPAVCEKVPAEIRRVVIDCEGLSFLDSTGANALLQVAMKLMGAGLELAIEHLSEDLREMLDVLGFFDLLEE